MDGHRLVVRLPWRDLQSTNLPLACNYSPVNASIFSLGLPPPTSAKESGILLEISKQGWMWTVKEFI